MAATLSIIGTGDFGCALGRRLRLGGYDVIFGSRHPNRRNVAAIDDIFAEKTTVTSIAEAMESSNIIVLCVHSTVHPSLAEFSSILQGKTVVDVSNVESGKPDQNKANAEKLAEILPGANVVKAFNTQSAYKLTSDTSGESSIVYVASDITKARIEVLEVVRTCNFVGVDSGLLSSARQLEEMPLQLCGEWFVAMVIFFVTFGFWVLWVLITYMFIDASPWSLFPSYYLNKAYATTTLTLLGLTYLPSGIAGLKQIINGTKYKRFPAWLDNWLKSRKYLGLLALLMSAMHGVISITTLNSKYHGDLFETSSTYVDLNSTEEIVVYHDSKMSWKGESLMSLGVMAVALMSILAITSIPAVGNLLNWRQWVFIQSYLGFVMLCVAELHCMVKGLPGWLEKTFLETLTSMTFLSSLIPWAAIFLRILLWLPCIGNYLTKIRKGWERVPVTEIESASKNGHLNKMENGSMSNKVKPESNGHSNASYTSEL